MRNIELLVPASSLEVLKIAVVFGADAVYIGGEAFGLRAKAKNFSQEDMAEGIAFAHEHGVKVYVTVNILAHNDDLPRVREYLQELKELKPDALIIADPGVFEIAKEICPEIERHISSDGDVARNDIYAKVLFHNIVGVLRKEINHELEKRQTEKKYVVNITQLHVIVHEINFLNCMMYNLKEKIKKKKVAQSILL